MTFGHTFLYGATTFPTVLFEIPLSSATRDQRLIALSNGLECLLVSDPAHDTAAAALTVAAGSESDPDSALGLAHLCEHVLFMGTKKFPDPSTYVQGILKNGGSLNAYTTGVRTTYQFQIPASTLGNEESEPLFNELVQNFASFFKQPKFDQSYLKRELNVIDGEHQLNCSNVDKVLYYGLKLLAVEGSPFARFSTGNLDTFNTKLHTLRHLLIQYYEREYHSTNMKLVLFGPQSVNQLQKLAIQNFSEIPESRGNSLNSSISRNRRSISISSSIISSNSSRRGSLNGITTKKYIGGCMLVGRVLHIKSDIASPRIRLVFPIEQTSQSLKSYQRIWSNLMGDESQGSLYKHLHELNFINALYAYSLHPTETTDVFILEIELTASGLKKRNLQQVVRAVFQYISLIVHSSEEVLREYIRECVAIDKLNYHFRDTNPDPMDEVAELSENLLEINEIGQEFVFKGYRWDFPNVEEFIRTTSQFLSVENLDIIVLSLKETNGLSVSATNWEIDPYFKFSYQISAIDFDPMQTTEGSLKFFIPQPNPFLPYTFEEIFNLTHDLQLVSSGDPLLKFVTKDLSSFSQPELIVSDSNHEIWYMQESVQQFGMVSLDYNCHTLPFNSKTTIGIELFCTMVGNYLNGELYPSELIGYTWEIYPNLNTRNSISITVSGLIRGLDMVIYSIIKTLEIYANNLPNCTYEEFKNARVSIRTKYENLNDSSSAVEQILAGTQLVLEKNVWGLDERIEALEEVEVVDIFEIATLILHPSQSFITIFQQSENLSSTEWYESIGRRIHPQVLRNFYYSFSPSSYRIPEHLDFIISNASSPKSQSNTICMYIQVGTRDSTWNRTFSKLLSIQLRGIATMELRIKRNLGYNIYTGQRINLTSIGLYIMVSSAQYDCQYLLDQVEDFLLSWVNQMEQIITDSTTFYREIVQSFLENYDKPDKGGIGSAIMNFGILSIIGSGRKPFGEKISRHKNHWNQIIDKTNRFGAIGGEEEVDIDMIKDMRPEIFILTFKYIISSRTRSSVTLMLHSELQLQNIQTQLKSFLESKGLTGILREKELIKISQDPNPMEMMFNLIRKKVQPINFSNMPPRKQLVVTYYLK